MVKRHVEFQKMPGAYTDEAFPAGDLSHVLDSDLDLSQDNSKIYNQSSSSRTQRRSIVGQKSLSGSLDTPIFTVGAPTLLYYLLGSVATAVGVPQIGSNTHTIKRADSIPPFWIGVGRDAKKHRYTGGALQGATIDIVPDATIDASFDVVSRKELATVAITTPTIPDLDLLERAFGGAEIDPKFGAAEGAVTSSNIFESISISIENNVQEDARNLGNLGFLSRLIVAELNISGSFDLAFDDATNYDEFLSDTQKRLTAKAVHDAGGASERSIQIDLPRIEYDTNGLPTENVQRYVEALEFTAQENAAGDPIVIDVVNVEDNATISA